VYWIISGLNKKNPTQWSAKHEKRRKPQPKEKRKTGPQDRIQELFGQQQWLVIHMVRDTSFLNVPP
jgi:hypothetical protein